MATKITNSGSDHSLIHSILHCSSVAIIGASNNELRWGYHVTNAIIQGGYQGNIYPVHPKEKQVLGVTAYPSITQVPNSVDLVIFCISKKYIPTVIPECIEKGVKAGVICASGYRETGNRELELELLNIIKRSSFRLIGPNVQGICYLPNQLCAQMGQVITKNGPIALISQSGSVTAIMAKWAENDDVGVSGMINLGNQIDLCESDFLEFFAEDPNTKVIGMYLEGSKDGKNFIQKLKICAKKKPIVVFKSGRTSKGRTVAASHTASLIGNDDIFSFAMKQAGVLRKFRLDDFYDSLKALATQIPPKGNRAFLFTTSGGIATIVADIFYEAGIDIVQLSPEIKNAISNENIPTGASVGNPFDIPSDDIDDFQQCFSQVAYWDKKSDLADVFVIILADPTPGIASTIKEFSSIIQKPLVVIFQSGDAIEKTESKNIQELGIPVYNLAERGAAGVISLVQYGNILKTMK